MRRWTSLEMLGRAPSEAFGPLDDIGGWSSVQLGPKDLKRLRAVRMLPGPAGGLRGASHGGPEAGLRPELPRRGELGRALRERRRAEEGRVRSSAGSRRFVGLL